ncbi:PepSY domain-containing protein [Streptomyces gobiensis]|uniref:PepSY domain-containing protein n=1 Tax=Streptomyces gobiensis TaxID=2875706 RepID=UPI001E5A143C|nr:PepSY domain-containing protein [Streptomyces gobiensis]UGY90709.1 PepSY domain-containing protein [Streptomyces gobiensis]
MNRKLIVAAIAATTLAAGGTAAAVTSPGDIKDSVGESTTPAAMPLSDTDDGVDGDNDDARELAKAKINAQEALEKALSAVPGTAESIELDDDNGSLVWDADIFGKDQKWHDVTIDPDTGKVLTDHAGQGDADDDGDDRDDDHDDKDDKDDKDDGNDD